MTDRIDNPATGSSKNPENEARHPGGRPTETVKGSAPAHGTDPQGQQGTNTPQQPNKDR